MLALLSLARLGGLPAPAADAYASASGISSTTTAAGRLLFGLLPCSARGDGPPPRGGLQGAPERFDEAESVPMLRRGLSCCRCPAPRWGMANEALALCPMSTDDPPRRPTRAVRSRVRSVCLRVFIHQLPCRPDSCNHCAAPKSCRREIPVLKSRMNVSRGFRPRDSVPFWEFGIRGPTTDPVDSLDVS